ncbi:hypothetical protein F5I97DRAFT_2006117 [Phlebopus sp. FC_14]|nr:hypothetical protein F5I97DRAFT_2006117 [Phlebopus sp. FC_14]
MDIQKSKGYLIHVPNMDNVSIVCHNNASERCLEHTYLCLIYQDIPDIEDMVGHAKSIQRKKHEASKDQENTLEQAIKLYNEKQTKPQDEQRSLHTICRGVQEEWQKHQKKGKKSHQKVNMENNDWLIFKEEESIIEYCLELATQGFLLGHKTLKLHVDRLLQARLGNTIEEKKIDKDYIWATNETGFQPGGGLKSQVFDAIKQKIQHQQHDGN